ncbi:hypothetical protein [Candidatus Sarmatiella mevalonica]|nr:hypothetical protein [Candidatus Sarmatiella mevalonica]
MKRKEEFLGKMILSVAAYSSVRRAQGSFDNKTTLQNRLCKRSNKRKKV